MSVSFSLKFEADADRNISLHSNRSVHLQLPAEGQLVTPCTTKLYEWKHDMSEAS